MLPNVRAVLIFLVLAVFSTEGAVKKTRKRVVCYYTNWSVYRLGLAKFLPNNINPHLCTHLIYAFGGFNDDFELQPFDKYQDIDKGGYARFNGLKQYNKGLRTLLALGGWNEGSSRFSELVADPEYRKRFIYSAIRYLRQYNFDGLDLDWEYPGSRGGSDPADKENYVKLCQELRVAFDEESVRSNRPVLLLTIAVPAGISTIDKGFNIAALNQQVDFFNILAYDYHASSEPLTDHHAPLLAPPGSSQFDYRSELNVDYTVRYYLKLGAERRKLVVGIPTYGRSYTLIDANFNDLQAAAESPGVKGKHTKEDGYLSFYEVCELIAVDDWKVFRPLPEVMGPYATKDKQWVGYDDEFAVAKKAEYVRDNFLGGIMFWSVDNDDFRGRCSGKPYPLIEAAKKAYLSPRQGSLPKQEKGPTPPPPPTPDPDADFECKREGFYPHPQQCNKYFWCLGGGPLGIVPHSFTCPTGLLFNRNTDACDFPRSVKCKIKQKEPESITFPPTKKPVITRAPVITGSTANPFDAFYEEYDTDDLPDLSLDDSDPFSAIDLSPPVRLSTFSTSNNVLGGSRGGQAAATIPPEPEESDPAELKQLLALITNLGGVEGVEKLLAGDQPTSSRITEKDRRTLQRIVGKQKERTINTSPGLTRNKASVRNRPPPRTPARTRISSLKSPAVQETGRGPTNTRRQPTGTGLAAGREESESIRRRRPQYTSIQRDRSSSSSVNSNEEVIKESPVQKQYTSIERNRIRSEVVEEDNSPLPARQYVTLNRNAASSESAAPQPSVVEEDFPSPKTLIDIEERQSPFAPPRRQNFERTTQQEVPPTTYKPLNRAALIASLESERESANQRRVEDDLTNQRRPSTNQRTQPNRRTNQIQRSRNRPTINRATNRLVQRFRHGGENSATELPDQISTTPSTFSQSSTIRRVSARSTPPPRSTPQPPTSTAATESVTRKTADSEDYPDYEYYYDYFFEYPDGSVREIPEPQLEDLQKEIEAAKKALLSGEYSEDTFRQNKKLFSFGVKSSSPLPQFFSSIDVNKDAIKLPDGYEVTEYKIPISGNRHEDIVIYEDEDGRHLVSSTYRPVTKRPNIRPKAEVSTLGYFIDGATTESARAIQKTTQAPENSFTEAPITERESSRFNPWRRPGSEKGRVQQSTIIPVTTAPKSRNSAETFGEALLHTSRNEPSFDNNDPGNISKEEPDISTGSVRFDNGQFIPDANFYSALKRMRGKNRGKLALVRLENRRERIKTSKKSPVRAIPKSDSNSSSGKAQRYDEQKERFKTKDKTSFEADESSRTPQAEKTRNVGSGNDRRGGSRWTRPRNQSRLITSGSKQREDGQQIAVVSKETSSTPTSIRKTTTRPRSRQFLLQSRGRLFNNQRRRVRKKSIVRVIDTNHNTRPESSKEFATPNSLLTTTEIPSYRSTTESTWQQRNRTISKTAVFVRREPGSAAPRVVGRGTVISRPGGERKLIVSQRPASEIQLIDSSTIGSVLTATPAPVRLRPSRAPIYQFSKDRTENSDSGGQSLDTSLSALFSGVSTTTMGPSLDDVRPPPTRTLVVHGQRSRRPITETFLAPGLFSLDLPEESEEPKANVHRGATADLDHVVTCFDIGTFPHPRSEFKFIQCSAPVNGRIAGTVFACPSGLKFQQASGACGWESQTPHI